MVDRDKLKLISKIYFCAIMVILAILYFLVETIAYDRIYKNHIISVLIGHLLDVFKHLAGSH